MLGFSLQFKGLEKIKKVLEKPLQRAMAKTLNQLADKIKIEQEK